MADTDFYLKHSQKLFVSSDEDESIISKVHIHAPHHSRCVFLCMEWNCGIPLDNDFKCCANIFLIQENLQRKNKYVRIELNVECLWLICYFFVVHFFGKIVLFREIVFGLHLKNDLNHYENEIFVTETLSTLSYLITQQDAFNNGFNQNDKIYNQSFHRGWKLCCTVLACW